MKIKVLIVDDSPFIHKAVTRALAGDIYEICGIGKNGKEGVELYFKLKPDVVTMDITMPVMNGLETAKMIVAQDPKARIIMLSAMGDEALIENAKAVGMKAFLQKPFKPEELVTAVRKIYLEG